MNTNNKPEWKFIEQEDGQGRVERVPVSDEQWTLTKADAEEPASVIQPSSVLDADLTPEQIADLQEFLDAEESNPADEDGSVTVKITEKDNVTGTIPVQNGGGGYISCAVSGVGSVNSLHYSGTTSMANLCFQADRILLSTELVNGTVKQIYHCDSPVTLACWPPRDTSWYEKEIWAPKGDDIVLISSVKGRKVPEHFEWEDGEEA